MSHKYDGALLSYGAGVNSTAMAIMLVNEGWRGPIVFADTGCEWPETYCFMDYFEEEWLNPNGFEVTRLKGIPWQRKSGGISLVDYCEHAHVIPIAHRRWCSIEWKRAPVERWAAQNRIGRQLIGFGTDELRRVRNATYPLIERGLDRKACKHIIGETGLSIPRKSTCWICPLQTDRQWRQLWELHPELFDRAMRLEEASRRTRNVRFRSHAVSDPRGRITLRQRKFGYERQLEMVL